MALGYSRLWSTAYQVEEGAAVLLTLSRGSLCVSLELERDVACTLPNRSRGRQRKPLPLVCVPGPYILFSLRKIIYMDPVGLDPTTKGL